MLGASEHDDDASARSPAATGLRYTTGTNRGMDPEAFAHARLILLWGSNPLTSHHHIWKFVAAAREAGRAPGRHRPGPHAHRAAQADEHLAPRPGTDAALALA